MFFLSSTCSMNRELNKVIKDLAELGTRNIELSGNIVLSDGWHKELQHLKKKYGLNLLIHSYFPPPLDGSFCLNLASKNPQIREKTFGLIQRAVTLADDLALPLYSIHGGHGVDVWPHADNTQFVIDKDSAQDREGATELFYESLDFVAQEILDGKCRLGIENLFPFRFSKEKDFSIIARREEIEDFLRYCKKYDNVGLLLDLGHLNVTGHRFGFDAAAFAHYILLNYPDKIFELHLSDNDGSYDVHYVNKTDSWQLRLLEEYPDVIRSLPIVFEWQSGTNIRSAIHKAFRAVNDRFDTVVSAI